MSRKHTGRPAGSKTQERVVIEHTPDPCPHCQSIIKPVNLTNKRRIVGSGRTADGRQYGAVVLRNANCGACGCAMVVRTYEFAPEIQTMN